MKYKAILLLSVTLLFVTSCGSGRLITGSSTANSTFLVKDIITSHKKASPNFKTLAGRVQLEYEDAKRSQSITASLRMEKDKKIWIKASFLGVTLAKVLITPTKVSYYESIGKTYFDGDFALLSEWLGTDINFEQAQAMLLGQSIFEMSPTIFTSQVVNNRYKLEPKRQSPQFLATLFLAPDTFKVSAETISQPSENRLLTVDYGTYQQLDGGIYPTSIKINATEKEDKTSVNLNYKKIDLNVSVNFPFEIPDGYTEIRL